MQPTASPKPMKEEAALKRNSRMFGKRPFRPVVFAPGLVPVFGVGEKAHDAGERVDDGRAAGGAGVVPAHGHVALRAAVDLVVHIGKEVVKGESSL